MTSTATPTPETTPARRADRSAGPGGQVRVAVAYHSGFGHTAQVAEAVARGVGQVPDAGAVLLAVDELSDELWAALAAADAIVFGAPTYMGSPSAVFKAFAEASSKVWAADLGWRDKIAAGFTVSKAMSGDKLNSLVDLAVLAAQHGMVWVGLDVYPGWADSAGNIEDLNRLGSWLGAMAQANGDQGPDLVPPATDLRTAEALGRRVAAVTVRHARGAAFAAGPDPAGPAAAGRVEPTVEELAAYTAGRS